MKKIIIIIGCLLLFCTACSSSKSMEKESVEFNKFERIEESFSNQMEDSTRIYVINTSNETSLFYEGISKVIDGYPSVVRFTKYEYNYLTGEKRELLLAEEDLLNCKPHICPNGNVLVYYDENGKLKLYNHDYEILAETIVGDIDIPSKKSNIQISYVSDFFSDENFIYLIGRNDSDQEILYVLDENLIGIKAYKAKDRWKYFYGEHNEIYFFDGCDEKAQMFDIDAKDMVVQKHRFPGEDMEFMEAQRVQGTGEYDYCYYMMNKTYDGTEESRSYLYGVKNGIKYKIFDLETMGMKDKNIESIVSDKQGGYFCFCNSYLLGEAQYFLYHFLPCSQAMDYTNRAGKEKIVIGCGAHREGMLNSYVAAYNAQSDKYYIELISYADLYDDSDMANTHLYLDCMKGEVDGILLDDLEEDSYIQNDLLEDLSHYLDLSTIMNKEDFIDHYLESVTDRKGRIYALYPYYEVGGYFSTELYDLADMSKYENQVTDVESFIACHSAKENLYRILVYSGNKYVDEETGELHLQENSFQSMLSLMKKQSRYEHTEYDELSQYNDGEAKMVLRTMQDPYDYILMQCIQGKNIYVQNIGSENALIWDRHELLAVNVNSKQKDGMYDFYDFIYQPSHYHNRFYFQYAPIFKSEWERWRKTMTATEEFTDDLGVINPVYNRTMIIPNVGMWEFSSGGIPEIEVDELINVFQKAEYIKPMREAYITIIIEESIEYFNGAISLEQACEIMENRISVAMEELR